MKVFGSTYRLGQPKRGRAISNMTHKARKSAAHASQYTKAWIATHLSKPEADAVAYKTPADEAKFYRAGYISPLYHPRSGSHISTFANELVSLANQHQTMVRGQFNGFVLHVRPGVDAKDVIEQYLAISGIS